MTRRHKYGAVKTVVDGITFPSKAEARRYGELQMLGVRDLELQPKFPVVINGAKICTYIADFAYLEINGDAVIEDVKGMKTPVYRLKKKLVEALYGITITEIGGK